MTGRGNTARRQPERCPGPATLTLHRTPCLHNGVIACEWRRLINLISTTRQTRQKPLPHAWKLDGGLHSGPLITPKMIKVVVQMDGWVCNDALEGRLKQ